MKYTDFESLTLLFTIFQLYCAEHICGWKQEWPGKEKNRLSSKSQWQSDVRKVWRYQRGYQKDRQHNCHRKIPKRLSEGQTTQLPQKDTKEVIRRTDNTSAKRKRTKWISFMVLNATFTYILAVSFRKPTEYAETTTDLKQFTDKL
jgi:hypothetical protein